MLAHFAPKAALAAGLALLAVGCADTGSGALAGGALGAAAGAAIGNNSGEGDAQTGALVGGVVGAIAGGYAGCRNEGRCGAVGNQRERFDQRTGRYYFYDPQSGRYFYENGEPYPG